MKLNHLLKHALVLLAGMAMAFSANSQDPNLHIYLCFGQSNMSGQGPLEAGDNVVSDRFKVMRAANIGNGQTVGGFYPGVPPLGHSASQLGPADFFGRRMVELLPENITVAVANVAIGGQSINLFDKATNASYIQNARNASEWWIQYLDQYGGDPYARLIELGNIAKQQGVIKGILFHQGEADYQMSDWPNRVKKVYDDLIADLNLNSNEVPILIGELLTTEVGGDLGWRNTAVAEAANLIPNGHLISAAGCPMLPGDTYRLHFSREGYQILGGRYAETMFSLLGDVGTGPTVTITSPSAGEIFEDPASITISADATVDEGNIVSVDFYANDIFLQSAVSPPYNYTWTGVSAGTYEITAVAEDDAGNTKTSAPVTVRVSAPAFIGDISVTASGVIGTEVLELEIDGIVVESWTLSTSMETYETTGNVNGAIRVNYVNDDTDMDVEVDYITVYGTIYQAEDQEINTAYYANGSCGGGNYSELMHCDGYIEFVTNPVSVVDLCPDDPNKTAPGTCGCGIPDTDTDNDGVADCEDECPNDPDKSLEGFCGCGVADVNTDGDEEYDCHDLCPNDPNKIAPGDCGCGVEEGACTPEGIALVAGWNLVGYPNPGSESIESAFSSIWSNIEVIKSFDAFYSTIGDPVFNLLNEVDYGKGYFVKVSADCYLVW